MDEMTALRELRADAPLTAPSPDVRRRALTTPAKPAHRPHRWPMWSLAGTAATVVAAVAVMGALQVGPGAQTSAAAVLDHAASQVRAEGAVEPRVDQWVFQDYLLATGGDEASPAQSWVRFDGTKVAEREAPTGQSLVHVQDVEDPGVTPQQWYVALVDLPEDSEALLARLRTSSLVHERGSTRAERDFDGIVHALSDPEVLPPSAQARLFRALGTIPGVGIDRDAAPDLVGRPVLSVTFTGTYGEPSTDVAGFRNKRELLLDPQTYAVRGERVTALEDAVLGSKGKAGPVTKGETWYVDTVVSTGVVDAPGDRPGP